jgi:hypothetical protein
VWKSNRRPTRNCPRNRVCSMVWRLITDSPVDFHIGEGEDEGWCRCNAGAPPEQAASGECLTVNRTCMASWTDASMGGTCGSQQTACSADSSGNACDGDSPWCCLDEECEGKGSGWCWCQP